ncbi:MAG: pyrroline-5-carboxylate reductase [Pseudomonadales bacterium]|nr:pyrroline-5-carboxylate reductase [Pseudomonadales bacterium]
MANIAFIGAGNMARSLMGGLLKQGYPAENLACSDPIEASLEAVAALGAVTTSTSNADIIEHADIVILAVKPQVMKDVLTPLQNILIAKKPLLVSIAAGIACDSLQEWAGEDVPIVRCMPNTPALLQVGATGLYATNKVSAEQQKMAEVILSAVGIVVWVAEEAELDAVTAVSGSGPAYFFLLMEAMQAAGQQLGLSAEASAQLTQQTALGAARMALESDVDVAELRKRVTSPNGTTQAAIESFQANDLSRIVDQALQAASDRSQALAKELA